MLVRFLARAAGAVVLVAGLSTSVLAGSASACSCFPGDTEAARYARADNVFTAVVLDRVLDPGGSSSVYDDKYRFTLQVGVEYKGSVPPAPVTVESTVHGSLCGTDLRVGVDYLLFATSYDGVLSTGSCSGNRGAADGPPDPGSNTASPCGTAL
ncbi:hypothetical protein [Actinosynnema sp.]|uniref:hypothetical protein n=1 Tax=Actinosynnema sp. TaxID=1872144 RepID=UPI003F84F34A